MAGRPRAENSAAAPSVVLPPTGHAWTQTQISPKMRRLNGTPPCAHSIRDRVLSRALERWAYLHGSALRLTERASPCSVHLTQPAGSCQPIAPGRQLAIFDLFARFLSGADPSFAEHTPHEEPNRQNTTPSSDSHTISNGKGCPKRSPRRPWHRDGVSTPGQERRIGRPLFTRSRGEGAENRGPRERSSTLSAHSVRSDADALRTVRYAGVREAATRAGDPGPSGRPADSTALRAGGTRIRRRLLRFPVHGSTGASATPRSARTAS